MRHFLPLLGLISACGFNAEIPQPTTDAGTAPPAQEGDIRRLRIGEFSVVYEVVGGRAIEQGDIVLGDAAELEVMAEAVQLEGNASSRRGLIAIKDDPSFPASLFYNERWPSARIPYVVSRTTYNTAERRDVVAAMDWVVAHFDERTNIQLVPRTDEDDYLLITDYEPGERPDRACGSSMIGMDGGEQEVNLIPTGSSGCLLHEVLHALGMPHEQSRSDRDLWVAIQENNIPSESQHNFEKKNSGVFERVGPYDLFSIMHYSATAFSTNTNASMCNLMDTSGCSIVPRNPRIDPQSIGVAIQLSPLDQAGLCQVYGDDGTILSAEFIGIEGMDNGAVVYRRNEPTLRIGLSRRGQRPEAPIVEVISDIDGEVIGSDPRPQSGLAGFDLPLGGLTPGRHTITVNSYTGCPKQVILQVLVQAGGNVRLSDSVIKEAERIQAFVDTAAALSDAETRDTPWFAQRVGESTRVLVATGSLITGVMLDDLCDGEYDIFPEPRTGVLSAGILSARLMVEQDDPPPAACRPSVSIDTPSNRALIVRDQVVNFAASYTDDQPQRDDPIHPLIWTLQSTGAELGRGPRMSASIAAVGMNTVTVQYGTARDNVFVEVVDSGTPPSVQITQPVVDAQYRLDVDVIGFMLTADVAATATHPDVTVDDQNIVWSISCPNLTTPMAATGRQDQLRARISHAGNKACDVTVRATGPGGLFATDSVQVFVEGPPF